MGIENLEKIFNPQRIAVIGASARDDSLGAKILRNLIGVGYMGSVFPVNAFRQSVQGIMAYPNISRIPKKIDLAIVATPAHTVPQIVEECGKSGVAGVIICSAGFREAGEEGFVLEKQILNHQKKYGIRIIGPNSFGLIRPKINLNATFGTRRAKPGKIAFISQSASLCSSALDWAQEAQVGFSAVVSTGSILDVDIGDLIDFFGMDSQTRSIVVFIESIRNARAFMSAARGFARSKPIILVKAGRFVESIVPTLSHSGSLSGEDAVYDAAFKRAGIVRVEGLTDLFNCAEALAMQPNPVGSDLTIITNAGGPGIMATDALVDRGGSLSELDDSTTENLRAVLPSYCAVNNPVDLFEDASIERFRSAMEVSLKNSSSSGFLLIYSPQVVADPMEIARLTVIMSKKTQKPILLALMGTDESCRTAKRFLQSHDIPVFNTPEQAVSTYMYMHSYTRNLELLYQTPEEIPLNLSAPPELKRLLRKLHCEGRKVLTLPEAFKFLEAYHIPTVRTILASNIKEAESATSEFGFPVVMKAVSPKIIHKSRTGGVILDVCSSEKMKETFSMLSKLVKSISDKQDFNGVAIQPVVQRTGYELFLGSNKDPQFGSVILFGTGGIGTEICGDIKIGFPPLNQVLARRLIEDSAVFRRAISVGLPFNEKAIEEFLVKFSQLVVDFPEIKEIDINPIIACDNEALAVDARIIIDTDQMNRRTTPYEHLVIAPYPRKFSKKLGLKNGLEVNLRPIKPEDEARFKQLFMSLSKETMHFRFFQIIKELTHETLTRYCNLDYDREIALVAEIGDENRSLIGVVRLIVEPGGRNSEFAVLVGDQWQGLGLGSKLMDSIIEVGRDLGVNRIYGYIDPDNQKMLDMIAKKGFKPECVDEDIVEVSIVFNN